MPDTKKCPYCAEEIKADAILCRHCGMNLETGQPIKAERQASPAEKPKRSTIMDGVRLGCGAFIVLPLLILGALWLIGTVAHNSTSVEPTKPLAGPSYAYLHREFIKPQTRQNQSELRTEWNNSYRYRPVKWTGTVKLVMIRQGSPPTVDVDMGIGSSTFDVTLTLRDSQRATAAALSRGDTVTFEGTLGELPSTVLPLHIHEVTLH